MLLRMPIVGCLLLLSIVLIGRVLGADQDGGGAADPAPTPAILLAKWDEYLSRFGEAVCEVRCQDYIGTSLETVEEDNRSSYRQRVTAISLSNGLAYVSDHLSKSDNTVTLTEVFVQNERYAFSLTRTPSGETELFELGLDAPFDDLPTNSQVVKGAKSWMEGAFATWAPFLSLREVLRHRSFRTTSVSRTPEGDWLVTFDCEVPGGLERIFYGPARLVVQSGGYCLPRSLSARVRTPLWSSSVIVEVEYTESFGLPRMSRFRSGSESLSPTKGRAESQICHLTWRPPTAADRDALYLGHYGLPDPTRPSRMNWWFVIGGLLVVAGVYQMSFRRRRSAT